MTMRNDAKFEEQLTCSFKIDMRNLTNEEWCKTWRKTDLWFGKWNEKFGKFLPEHTKVSKLGLRWDPFIQSRKCMRLKVTCHDNVLWQWRMIQNLKRNWLVASKLTPQFDECWPMHSTVSKMYALMVSFWPKYIMFELKKYRKIMFDGTEDWCKIWRKTDLCFSKWHEKFGKFSQPEK